MQVEFWNHPVDDSPEGKMLLGMQGLFAEYERAKILERTRRGKLHSARSGHIVGGIAPYGYTYVKREGNQPGHYIINEAEAEVVRMAYRWLLEDGLSLRGIAKQLTGLGIPTRQGLPRWCQSAAGKLLKSEVYAGTAYFYKTYPDVPERHREHKPYRKFPKSTKRLRGKEEWISIPVPAIIQRATWEQAQRQLRENAARSPRNNRRFQYLLRGLVKCGICGLSWAGGPNGGKPYYRCGGKDGMAARVERCPSRSIQAEVLDTLVWNAMTRALQEPGLLAQEWQRRKAQSQMPDDIEAQMKQADLALRCLKAQEDRVTDAYINEAMELDRYKAEMEKLRQRRKELERAAQELDRRERQEIESRKALEHLERFCRQVSQGLDAMTFEERQQLLRLLVERITVEDGRVRIETVIPTGEEGKLRTRHPERSEGSCVW